MAVGEDVIDRVNVRLRRPGGGPGRSGDMNFGLFMASRLTCQRAMRRAWRGRSSRASLRAWSLRWRRCIGQAIGGRRGNGHRPGPQVVNPGISRRNGCAVEASCISSGAGAARRNFPRIEELEGGEPAPAALPDHCPLGMGREGANFTTTSRAAMTIRRRTADSAGRSTAARRCAGAGESAKPWLAVKPQQGEQDFNDALERFAVAFDGPVHQSLFQSMVFPILIKNKTGTQMAC